MTLDQAVIKVQQDTGGKVLSAGQRGVGHRQLRYRIKVLTPDGHVKAIVVSSECRQESARQSTKNPPVKRADSKEKH